MQLHGGVLTKPWTSCVFVAAYHQFGCRRHTIMLCDRLVFYCGTGYVMSLGNVNTSSFMESLHATSIRRARLVLIRLRRLEQIANYMMEASVPTMIFFCVKSAKMLMTYIIHGRRFGPVAFINAWFRMRLTTLQSYMIFIGSSST